MLGKTGRVADVATGLVPALALAAWLIAGVPLLLAGHLTPAATITLATVLTLALLLVVLGMRPFSPESDGQSALHSGVPVLLTVAVAGGFAALAWTTSSEHVVVRRDPGVYAQTADWLAEHGSLPIPNRAQVFGKQPGLTFESPGFYQRDDHIEPQFMTGTAVALTPAGWAAGLRGITRSDAVVGALALLAVAAFTRRVAGAWGGLLATLGLAFAYPELHQARSAFSEPAAQLLFFGGLALLVDAYRAPAGRGRTALHAVAGLVLGLGVVVRIDALIELVFVIPALGVMSVRGRARDAALTAVGVAAGVILGLVDGVLVARPYLGTLGHELRLAGAAVVLMTVATLVALTAPVRRVVQRLVSTRWFPQLAALVVVVSAAAAYFVRPHLGRPRYAASDPAAADVVALQQHLGLPADGPRTYAEQSMHWLTWWLGPTGIALAVLGLALLVRALARGRCDDLLVFVFVLLGTTAVVLTRPSITPDHPWADRRFVPVVLPGLVVAASWLVARCVRWVRERSSKAAARTVAVLGAAALIGPAIAASWPLLGRSTERGELSAVQSMCAALPARAAVLVVGTRAAEEWPQVIRGACHAPVATVTDAESHTVLRDAAGAARRNGWQAVVVSDNAAMLSGLTGALPRHVVHLVTREPDHQLTRRPSRTRAVSIDVWLTDVTL